MVNPISVDSIGGLELLKDWFITRSVCFSEEARKAKVDAPKGVALIGPPGTGKSVCSKAVASILNLPLVRVDLGRLFGSLVGQTEARTRTMLKELEAMAPCIVWVDEVDKAGLSSGANGDSGVSSRLLGSLLTHMSEMSLACSGFSPPTGRKTFRRNSCGRGGWMKSFPFCLRLGLNAARF